MNEDTIAQSPSGETLMPTLAHYDRAIERIRKHIAECDKNLAMRKADPLKEDSNNFGFALIDERERAFRDGLKQALEYLYIR